MDPSILSAVEVVEVVEVVKVVKVVKVVRVVELRWSITDHGQALILCIKSITYSVSMDR